MSQMRPGFFFNLNKCVGCFACVVACQIENGREQTIPWREINTHNTFQHPDLPVFHYSLACNHCEDAPCMSSCPALAYTRDETLGTVVHHANRCIGCKYCTWACPYDAPKFSDLNGTVEKCTSCQEQLEARQKPACAKLCPTGALDYKEIETKEQSRIRGFTELGFGPGIEIIPLRKQHPPRTILKLEKEEIRQYEELEKKLESKISLRNEWILVLFTLLVPLMTAWMASESFGLTVSSPWLFGLAGISGLILSSLHLGKKQRAWRSVLNVKESWLSREILGYGLFLALAGLFFFLSEPGYSGLFSVLFGFGTCYSIDKVYGHFEKNTRLDLQSNSVFLTAILFTSLLLGNEMVVYVLMGLKLLLYLYRKLYYQFHNRKVSLGVSLVRVIIGFILPVLFVFFTTIRFEWIFLAIVLGEIIDRAEFYSEAEIINPKREIILGIQNL